MSSDNNDVEQLMKQVAVGETTGRLWAAWRLASVRPTF